MVDLCLLLTVFGRKMHAGHGEINLKARNMFCFDEALQNFGAADV